MAICPRLYFKNLAKIRRHNMSVGVFAPGWTFERVSDLGINHKTVRGTELCNRAFIERNNRFWALLWPSMYTSSYAVLPFYSSFCLGSGKQRYQDGILCQPTTSWFKLDLQSLQPSVPQQHIEYDFEESYSGGCRIRVLHADGSDLRPRRLFSVDWQLVYGLIVAYAFKSVAGNENQVSLWLRTESAEGNISRIECGSDENNRTLQTDDRYIFPLKGADLRAVIIHISTGHEKSLPETASNEWMVRYYYVTSDLSQRELVTDIGFGKQQGGQPSYLGAVHVHRGSEALYNRFKQIL